jgi:hypothetical protein
MGSITDIHPLDDVARYTGEPLGFFDVFFARILGKWFTVQPRSEYGSIHVPRVPSLSHMVKGRPGIMLK